MSAVNSSTFANRKPNLTGNTSLSMNTSGLSNPPQDTSTCGLGNAGVWITYASANITISEIPNNIRLYAQGRFNKTSGGNMQIRLIRDGDTGSPILGPLNVGTGTAGNISQSHVIVDETVAAHAYLWQENQTQNEPHCVGQVYSSNVFSEVDDTHNSKNANIIRG
jgi:hypothetical protein